MSTIDVVADANVVLKWFHASGEEEVDASRALLDAHRARSASVMVLDLTAYEVGNALLRGRAQLAPARVDTVLGALRDICPSVHLDADDWRCATALASDHELTVYDAAYAAVARNRGAVLATLDHALLAAGLGERPRDVAARLAADG